MKNRFKSILILILCVAFLIPSAKVEAGSSVKQQAQAPVKNFYKYAKTLNLKKMGSYVYKKDNNNSQGSLTSSQTKKLQGVIKKENKKKLSYKIVSTKLSKNKKSATIKVKVTYRSLYKAGYYGYSKTLTKTLDYYYENGKMPSQSKVNGWLIQHIVNGAKKYPSKQVSKTITIRTKKYGNKWKIVENTDAMMNSYSCNIFKGLDAAADEF